MGRSLGAGREERQKRTERPRRGGGQEGIEGKRKRRKNIGRLMYCEKIRESERRRYGTIIRTSCIFPEP